jgi:hypothetical protein
VLGGRFGDGVTAEPPGGAVAVEGGG